jgi:carbon storage regulator
MLVLTRKQGEEIIIGDNIRLTVVGIGGTRVRLGFAAPPDVHIRREECSQEGEDHRTQAVRPRAPQEES